MEQQKNINFIGKKVDWQPLWSSQKLGCRQPMKEDFPFRYDVSEHGAKYYGYGPGDLIFEQVFSGFKNNQFQCFYEEYEPSWPTKGIIDLDAKGVNWNEEECNRRLASFLSLLLKFFEHRKIERDMLLILDSSDLQAGIFSKHIIFYRTPFYYSCVSALKDEMEKFKDWIENLYENHHPDAAMLYLQERQCIFDTSIYGNERCMRILWCSKKGQNRPLIASPDDRQLSVDAAKHLFYDSLMQFISSYQKECITPSPVLLKRQRTLTSLEHDSAKIPKVESMELKKFIDHIKESFGIEIDHAVEKGTATFLIPKKSRASKNCPFAKREHKSNTNYFVILSHDGQQIIERRCYDEECSGKVAVIDQPPEMPNSFRREFALSLFPKQCTLQEWGKYEEKIVGYLNKFFGYIENTASYIQQFKDSSGNCLECGVFGRDKLKTALESNSISVCFTDDKPRDFQLHNLFAKSKYRKNYSSLCFAPYSPLSSDSSCGNAFNTFKGFGISYDPNFTVDTTVIQPVLNHLHQIWCNRNDEAFQYLIRWLAHALQKPHEVPGVAIILTSPQGAGKNILTDFLFKKLFAPYGTYTADLTHLTGKFTSLSTEKILVILDEVQGTNTAATSDRLKSIITQQTTSMEKKFADARLVESFRRFIFCSNHENPLFIEPDDRRFFVLRVSAEKKGNFEYFEQLYNGLGDNCAVHLFHYLLRLDIQDFVVAKFPNTQAKKDIISQTVSPVVEFLGEFVEGTLGDGISLDVTEAKPVIFSDLYKSFSRWCSESGIKPVPSTRCFSADIKKMFSISAKTKRFGGATRKILEFPDKGKIIETLERHGLSTDP